MFIKIKVTAGSKKEKVEKKAEDLYFVSVKEEAERNLANRRVIEIVKGMHPGKSVRIIHGHRGSSKMIEVSEG